MSQIEPRNLFVGIEGNIGVGKSTVAKKVAAILGYEYHPEPTTGSIERLRKKFYADMKQYAALFQTKIFLRRFVDHQRIILDLAMKGAIQDRTIYGDKPFAYMLHAAGLISDEEIEVYEELWGVFRHSLVKPDIMFFLDADTDILMERIHGTRKHPEESGITPEYLNTLKLNIEELYEDRAADGVMCFKFNWNDPNTHIDDMAYLINHTAKMRASKWSRLR